MFFPLINDSAASCTYQMQTPGLERDLEEPRLEYWAESHLTSRSGVILPCNHSHWEEVLHWANKNTEMREVSLRKNKEPNWLFWRKTAKGTEKVIVLKNIFLSRHFKLVFFLIYWKYKCIGTLKLLSDLGLKTNFATRILFAPLPWMAM